MESKTERDCRVQKLYDEIMAEGKHGHYETMFRIVRLEVEAEREACAKAAEAGHACYPFYQGSEFSRGCLWAGANIRARSNV